MAKIKKQDNETEEQFNIRLIKQGIYERSNRSERTSWERKRKNLEKDTM